MTTVPTDNRPPAGWSERPNDTLVYVEHDATFLSRPPQREGFVPYFIGRHGIGPGSWTSWSYKRLPR